MSDSVKQVRDDLLQVINKNSESSAATISALLAMVEILACEMASHRLLNVDATVKTLEAKAESGSVHQNFSSVLLDLASTLRATQLAAEGDLQ